MFCIIIKAAAFGAKLDACVYLGIFCEALAGDHGQVATLYVVSFVTYLVCAAVVIGLINLAADRPWLKWVNRFSEKTLLTRVRESKLDAIFLACERLILVILDALRFHALSVLGAGAVSDVARVDGLTVEADLVLVAWVSVLVLPAANWPWCF